MLIKEQNAKRKSLTALNLNNGISINLSVHTVKTMQCSFTFDLFCKYYLNINVSRPSLKNESTVYFISFVYLFYYICQFFFTLFLCSCSYCILSYVYKTLKMPAHWCIYKFMFYIHLIKYLFCISEYKAMLI